ncbi:hypothetical protein ACIA59_23985 [Micromonospora haikouensis]|uniref:hypothetical protein n=1 Tax=Micromonospora haikouensis TaxID=686309 RepID=UPI0037B78089
MGRNARLRAAKKGRALKQSVGTSAAEPTSTTLDESPSIVANPSSAVAPSTGLDRDPGQAGQSSPQDPPIGELVEWLDEYEALHNTSVANPASPEDLPTTRLLRQWGEAKKLPNAEGVLTTLDHMEQALAWLSAAGQSASTDAADPAAILDTQGLYHSIVNLFDHVQVNILLLEESLRIIAEGRPLAATFRNGERWGGKLNPRQIAYLAGNVIPGTDTIAYLDGRANHALAEATEVVCHGGPNRKKCGGKRVRKADGTRATSCWPHLTSEEKATIRAEREAAMEQPCILCKAEPGHPCVDERGAETTIHNYRLRPDAARNQRMLEA